MFKVNGKWMSDSEGSAQLQARPKSSPNVGYSMDGKVAWYAYTTAKVLSLTTREMAVQMQLDPKQTASAIGSNCKDTDVVAWCTKYLGRI